MTDAESTKRKLDALQGFLDYLDTEMQGDFSSEDQIVNFITGVTSDAVLTSLRKRMKKTGQCVDEVQPVPYSKEKYKRAVKQAVQEHDFLGQYKSFPRIPTIRKESKSSAPASVHNEEPEEKAEKIRGFRETSLCVLIVILLFISIFVSFQYTETIVDRMILFLFMFGQAATILFLGIIFDDMTGMLEAFFSKILLAIQVFCLQFFLLVMFLFLVACYVKVMEKLPVEHGMKALITLVVAFFILAAMYIFRIAIWFSRM